MLLIAIAAMLCGAKNCSDIWRFAQEKEEMLREVLTLEHGIPSHDTFSALFRKLDPAAFAEAFASFMRRVAGAAGGNRQIALDGKAMRGAFEKGRQYAPRMLVSAWGAELRMTLAAVPAVSGNEAKAAIELLQLLDLRGARGHGRCAALLGPDGAKRSRAAVATTRIALKGNQGPLLAAAEQLVGRARTPKAAMAVTEEEGHGRLGEAGGARRAGAWARPQAQLHRAERDRRDQAARASSAASGEEQRCLYVLSRPMRAEDLLAVVRQHWDIENGLHWGLDVVFREDECRTSKDHGPENLALLRRFCVNTFRADSKKDTMRGKMMRAGWNDCLPLPPHRLKCDSPA